MPPPEEKPHGSNRGVRKFERPHANLIPDDTQADFITAMESAGLTIRDSILADGRLHRFRVDGDRAGSKNGWYVLYGGNLPAGAFGCWKRGISSTWCAKDKATLTAAERTEYRQRLNAARKAREAEEQTRHDAAKEKARLIWDVAPPASNKHPYLVKKSVRNHGLRLYKEALVIPLCADSGALHSLQFIDTEGNKRFLSGGQIAGCFYLVGIPEDTLCICEGYATAASIHDATGHAVAVAFNCGNLLAVAQTLRRKFPAIKLILCADNDTQTDGNPGMTKAWDAASAVGALLAVPPCHGDFNDLLNGGAQ